MDVEFLSRMIGDLILDHDSLSLPGLGTFVAEDMPASFSDRGYTVNPPYRRLSFSERESADGLLIQQYAFSNGIGNEEAEAILGAFLRDLGQTLCRDKLVDLPGLGRLRSTREGHFFFVADEDLDISPDTCGLEPVSLKSHANASLPDISQAQQPSQMPLEIIEPILEPEPVAEPEPAEEPEPAPTPVAEPKPEIELKPEPGPKPEPVQKSKPRRRALGWVLGTIGAAAVLLLAFVLASRLAPGSTDRLLYTPEELAIINAPEDGFGLPR